jgi:putative phosphoribosyl transferase
MSSINVHIDLASKITLEGDLMIPPDAQGLVIFAHGSGSSHSSRRNYFVSGVLQQAGFATLLFDLLTPEEDRSHHDRRFDIPFLSERLVHATQWALGQDALADLRVGYFGASTGAAAALLAATKLPQQIFAIVSRGGRPDLASSALSLVEAPTLLIVGGQDREVLALNEGIRGKLRCTNDIKIIDNASHIFEEPGALEHVALLASEWFQQHLPRASRVVDLRGRVDPLVTESSSSVTNWDRLRAHRAGTRSALAIAKEKP